MGSRRDIGAVFGRQMARWVQEGCPPIAMSTRPKRIGIVTQPRTPANDESGWFCMACGGYNEHAGPLIGGGSTICPQCNKVVPGQDV